VDGYPYMTPEQRNKLPKWGRTYIAALEEAHRREVKRADEAQRELAEGPGDSRVRVDGVNVTPDRLLPDDSVVVFQLEPGEYRRWHGTLAAELRKSGDGSVVLEVSSGDSRGNIAVIPQNGNRVHLRAEKW
jgi:hypothetical protein